MILFVFEGKRREKELFLTLEKLFLKQQSESILHCYEGNIYDFYQKLSQGGSLSSSEAELDFVTVLQNRAKERKDTKNEILGKDRYLFSQIYLFFDYDPQHREKNKSERDLHWRIKAMLEFFDD